MSDPPAAMFHATTSGNVNESELINSGRDTTQQKGYNVNIADPATQMQELLRGFDQYHTILNDLDHFYTITLRNVVPENCDDDDIVSRYQSIIGAIIFVQPPLHVSALSHIIDINVEEIHAVLDKLQLVIFLGGDNVPRVRHESFPNYLMDQARCKDPRLRIDPRICHTQIATRCFEIMNKHLKRNILGLSHPARFMSNEDGLKEDGITHEQLEEKIPQQLRYACVSWINHLEVANINDDLLKGLKKFMDEHMLHWFELLSLIGKLDLAHHAICIALKFLAWSLSDLHQILSDALRFISKFYETIERSALHTYYSALPFTATDSLLSRRYNKEAVDNICYVEGGPVKWEALVANLCHGEPVNVIKCSLDSTLFISWSEDHRTDVQRKLKIWDAATGTPISTILSHRFAVANDFSTVASSENKTITFYNANGSTRGTMFTTPSKIQKLALSSESSRVAAALSDDTVWLWNSSNAELIDRFDGFGGSGRLEFSPTGTRLAYSTVNGSQLRDGISGRFIADMQCGLSHKFKFSGDGSRIASVSPDDSLTLWNSESGGLIDALADVGRHGLAISANGSLLATADHTKVTLWTESCNRLAQIKVLEVEFAASSMVFSWDNILAIANYVGIKLYNINTHSFIHTLVSSRYPMTLAFSPDCTRLLAGEYHGILNLWDIQSIDASSPPAVNATAVTALAFSRDCSRLARGFEDGRIELRETSPTKPRIGQPPLWSKMEAIFGQSRHMESIRALGFDPEDRLFASGSDDGTIKLWNIGDEALCGTLKVPSGLQAVALSSSVLVATWGKWHEEHYDSSVTLWSLDTLSPIHTFKGSNDEAFRVSIAENSALIAAASRRHVDLLDVVNRTAITTFDAPFLIHTMAFLSDNSQLVAQSREGVFRSFNLINHHITEGPTLEHLIQLPNTPLWHGVPIWHCQDREQHYFSALFSQAKSPVPVLWIPREILVTDWIQGSSVIALGCRNGCVIILRLPTTHVS